MVRADLAGTGVGTITQRLLRLLGPVQLEIDGKNAQGFRSKKTIALLGYLAVESRPVARTSLAALFWPDMEPQSARRELSRSLHNLSSNLPDCLMTDRRMVEFRGSDDCPIDLRLFEQYANCERITELKQAAELYQGELMEGHWLPDCAEFETWLMVERERRRQQVVLLLNRLVKHHTEAAEFEPALAYARRLLSVTPWQEDAHRQVMLLLARTGQVSAAIDQYEMCRQILQTELDVEPSLETERLTRRLRTMQVLNLDQLPPQATAFVGREQEMQMLVQRISDPECRLITLTGIGGIGKSRLAIQAAHQVNNDNLRMFLDGVAFVSLEDLALAEYLPIAIANALHIASAGREPVETQVLDYLSEREMLLILDNYEHLLPDTNFVTRLLAWAPDLTLLVTSRKRLNLREEWLQDVLGLSYPTEFTQPVIAKSLLAFDAVRLLQACALRLRPDFSIVDEAEHVVRLCQMVEGLPLALELAAGWLRAISCRELVLEVSKGSEILSSREHNIPERHRSIEALFDIIVNALPLEVRQVFGRLSVFRGGFTKEAAVIVAGATLPILRVMMENSLIDLTPEGRYRLHELVRQYAARQLARSQDDWDRCQNTHMAFYADLLARSETEVMSGRQLAALNEVEAELANTYATWNQANRQKDVASIARIIRPLALFYELNGRFKEAEDFFRVAGELLDWLDKTDPIQASAHGRLMAWWAFFEFRVGSPNDSAEIAEQSLKLLRQHDPTSLEMAWSLYMLGHIADYRGEIASAEALLSEGVCLCRDAGHQWAEAFILARLGHVYAISGRDRWGAAEEIFHHALMIARKTGSPWLLFFVLFIAADLPRRKGQLTQALRLYQEAYSAAEKANYSWGIGLAHDKIGRTYLAMKQPTKARHHLGQCILLYRETGDYREEAYALQNLAELAYDESKFRQADELYNRTLTHFEHYDDAIGIAWAKQGLGRIAVKQGQMTEALELLGSSLSYFRGTSNGSAISGIFTALAEICLNREEASAAAQLIGAAVAVKGRTGSTDDSEIEQVSARALETLGQVDFDRHWTEGNRLSQTGAEVLAFEQITLIQTGRSDFGVTQ